MYLRWNTAAWPTHVGQHLKVGIAGHRRNLTMAIYHKHKNPDQTSIEARENSVRGIYGGNPWNDHNSGNVRTGWLTRSDTYATSDHASPTYWSSNHGFVEEQPLIARRREYDRNGHLTTDVTDTFWISRRAPDPFAWFVSGKTYAQAGNQVNRVDTELLTKLASERDGVRAQFGASIGEAKKTVDMLAGAVIPPVKALHAFSRGRWSEMLGYLGLNGKHVRASTAADIWLAYKYGWKPLLQDCFDAYQLLHKKIAEPMILKCHHSRTLTVTSEGNGWSREESVRNGIGVKAQFIPSGLSGLDSAGLLNPLSIAWELVPYSFVVDWFIPIGNTLSALTATADLQFLSGYRNSKITDRYTMYDNGGRSQELIQQGIYTVYRGAFNRVPMGSFPFPKLYANTNPLSTERSVSAVALISQLFTGRK